VNFSERKRLSRLKRAWNRLCVTITFIVSLKNSTILCVVPQTVFLCQRSCVNWRMSRNSEILARSGRVRTNLHDLLCYHVANIVHCMVG
jgi:hypothetical protein